MEDVTDYCTAEDMECLLKNLEAATDASNGVRLSALVPAAANCSEVEGLATMYPVVKVRTTDLKTPLPIQKTEPHIKPKLSCKRKQERSVNCRIPHTKKKASKKKSTKIDPRKSNESIHSNSSSVGRTLIKMGCKGKT